MMEIRVAAIAALCVAAMASLVSAAPLAPSKPSQLVTGFISNSSPACPDDLPNGYQLALQLQSNGTQTALSIPPKTVLAA